MRPFWRSRGRAADDLAALLQGTGMPMASSFKAKGILPAHHPQNLGAFGLPAED
ncbi:hypothetical protein N0B44_28695 [Roseibacterium beibuensis]|uniref:hypothetical protein n=1 Tax=[Roseibacterium] beibuensis TaxID=1193142 RepID=UPI00217D3FA6|nr:hypothetical protein [Roseibacterium beibuensis]MCS6626902.1 hypothetical protein [Roseibacterium beibuensis]